jgi:superfamily II DNA/RNA helicase
MTQFIDDLALQIKNGNGYAAASKELFSAYISELVGDTKRLDRSLIKKLMSSAQIFYKSGDNDLRSEGAIILSMLLDVCAKDHPEIVFISKTIFAYVGDFPNIELLGKRHSELDLTCNFYLDAQMEFREALNTVEGLDFPLTDFQRNLWNDLTSDLDVITAAPTSAGKTHIILNYLLNEVIVSDECFVAVIVPTRALISEVAGKIYELAKARNFENEIEIYTVPKDNKTFSEKAFFVMTQERLHEILLIGDVYFNYLFIDEAHNITDKSRGVLLHLTIERILSDSLPQVIISMPSASYQDSFSTIFKGIDFKKEITPHSPVAKIVINVVPKGRDLVLSRYGSDDVEVISKGFKEKHVADIVMRLGRGQSNIIYRNRTSDCESLADDISNRILTNIDSSVLEDAADYIEKFIHDQFSLANNLRKGVAFHYGPLPGSVRVMIENLAKDGRIMFIVCTSTLAEGVNLPAKNLFLKNPAQVVPNLPSERIDDVKIKNITGRAGRMLKHFSGNIFLIEPDAWTFKDYFDEESEEDEKIPTYFKSLNEEFDSVLVALDGSYPHDQQDQYRFYTIANKLIKEFDNNRSLDDTLSADELALTKKQQATLEARVKLAYSKLRVAAFTLDANPTVGYIQQNKLFAFLDDQEDFDSWVLPHPMANDLYESLLRVCRKLHEFGVYIPTENYSLEYICLITSRWIKGKSLKSIITKQIEWDSSNVVNQSGSVSVNASVRHVIKAINNDIRFRLSNALRCYYVLLSNVLVSNDINLSNVKLHSFIEIGACEERMINLINMGLSREAAKEIHEKVDGSEPIKTSKQLMALYNNGRLANVHAVIKKEIIGLLT